MGDRKLFTDSVPSPITPDEASRRYAAQQMTPVEAAVFDIEATINEKTSKPGHKNYYEIPYLPLVEVIIALRNKGWAVNYSKRPQGTVYSSLVIFLYHSYE